MKILEIIGNLIDGEDDHWEVICPKCGRIFEYQGFYDPEDKTECNCGCVFTTIIPDFV